MRGFDMTKGYHRCFNSPEEVSLDNIEKKFGKIIQAELNFKDTGRKYNFQFQSPHKQVKCNESCKSIPVEWLDFQEKLKIAQISRIMVYNKESGYFILFWQNGNIIDEIVCKDIVGLP
jgi:hypothetical protein